MDILIVTLFVSVLLVVAGLVLFVLRLGAGDFEHGDRLSLLPLEQDEAAEPFEEPMMPMFQSRKAEPNGSRNGS